MLLSKEPLLLALLWLKQGLLALILMDGVTEPETDDDCDRAGETADDKPLEQTNYN